MTHEKELDKMEGVIAMLLSANTRALELLGTIQNPTGPVLAAIATLKGEKKWRKR